MSTFSNNVTIKTRGGNKENLPASAPERELLVTLDTGELFVGTGTGVKQIGGGLPKHQTKYTLYEDNAGVFADGSPGAFDVRGREGWYFTNLILGQKVSWYYYDPSQITTTVSQFQSSYAVVTIDTNRVPYFAVYTIGTDFGWYKSRRVYAVQSPATVTPGKYLIYSGANPSVYPELLRIQFAEMTSLSKGAFAPNEQILATTLQTDSGLAAGNYKFVAHQLGFQTDELLQEFDLKIKGDATRSFTFNTPNTTWNVYHGMGKRPSVSVVDTNGNAIDGQVVYNSDNQITVYFSPAVAGTVYLN